MKKLYMLAAVALLTFGMASCDKDDNTTSNTTTTTTGGGSAHSTTSGQWVNLGLPSGLLWYSVNIGATSPGDYGDYYAWGETQTKSVYSWDTYTYVDYDSENDTFTLYKYNTSSSYGTVDNKTTLESSDDVATQVLGNGARIPTIAEWQELLDNTIAVWTTVNGVAGRKYIASNGNSLFLPAAGYRIDSEFNDEGPCGYYWSVKLDEDNPLYAWSMSFISYDQYLDTRGGIRLVGYSVRAVRSQN